MTTTVDATFCFVDVAGFTALTEAHGDNAAADLVQRFNAIVESTLNPPGRIVDAVGDSVLVIHPEPVSALRFVSTLFAEVQMLSEFPALSAGLHCGAVVARNERYFGAALNLAARVSARAQGGEALCTAVVARHAKAAGLSTASLGFRRLRNVRDPVEIFILEVPPSPASLTVDPVCRMRVPGNRENLRLLQGHRTIVFCSLACLAKYAADPSAYAPGSSDRT